MLNILEHDDLPKLGHNTEDYLVTMARAQIAAMIDRAEHVGDPAFVDVPVAMLTSKDRADYWRQRINSGERLTVPRYQPDSPTTTNVTVVDSTGNCLAITHTLGASSGAITPGLGFMYNNAMNCFDPRPGTVNSIAPGKGRITGIAPTIAFTDGRPAVVLGAPGGTRIMTGILQALVNILAFDMTAVEAVSAPRFDCQSDTLDAEARIPSWVKEAAADRAGLKLWPNPAPFGNFALVQAAILNHETGLVTGGADPRSGGAVMTG
jgi:gamma-glutamyltranspeptidase/glutathione hydrolase